MKRLVKTSFKLLFAFSIIGALLISCEEEVYIREIPDDLPVISSFNPTEGLNGSLITVKGEYLKNVDSAAFGTSEAIIHRIINDNEIVLKVTNSTESGNITLKNQLGSTLSSQSFTMQYVVPTASEWPNSGEINQDVSILGTNLQSVTNVYFTSFGSTTPSQAKIVFQKDDELAVQVPFVDADWANVDKTRATLSLEYNTENGMEIIPGPGPTFSAEKPPFEVTTWPTAVLKNSQINILGTNINLADSVFFGDVPGIIDFASATPNSIKVTVPNFNNRTFVTMRIVYFKNLVEENSIQTEVYTKRRKTLANFEGGISSMILRPDRIAPGVDYNLVHSADTPLVAAEGGFYTSYYSTPDAINKSSVPLYFNYDEGEGNTINLNAFEDPVLHFYYFNDSTAAYLQLEVTMGGSNMRVYIERYRTNTQNWELCCVRLKDVEFGAGYAGPFGPIPWKDAYEALHINYKPSEKYSTQFHLDNIFISEGAIEGSIDLTKHTKENDFEISIVD